MRALLLAFVLGLAACATNPVAMVHSTTHQITMRSEDGSGRCSATAVGPHVLLTAEHCLVGAVSLQVDGKDVAVSDVVLDHADHALVTIDATLEDYAEVSGAVGQGDEVFICGNPGILQDQCRFGHVAGTVVSDNRRWTLYDLNGFFGDSGSGIFDSHGRLVGVISVELSQVANDAYMKEMGSLPLAFTKEQWAAVVDSQPELVTPIDDPDQD